MSILNEGLIHLIKASEPWQLTLTTSLFVLLIIVSSYLLGSVNSAIIISKLFYNDDIRRHGSGNAGMTNMQRTYGKKAAILTLVGDMLKTVIAILIAALLFGFNYNHGISLNDGYCYIAGLFAVIGHVFPIYYGFKGGKGVLVTATMALILTPVPFLILITLFIIIVAASKYVSLGSVTVAALYPVLVNGYIKFVFQSPPPGILALCTVILAIFIVWCHRANLKRISEGTENKLSLKKKNTDEKEYR